MKTVDKALAVLDQFWLEKREIGLNDLSRMAGLDKAATRRLLVALGKHGFIEQSEETRKYRLGVGFLRLARIREATVPVAAAAQEVADWLLEQTQETVHVSLPGPMGMTMIAHCLPRRSHLINIVPSELLLYHATASGLAYLSAASEDTVARILALKRDKVTDQTVTGKADLIKLINQFRTMGYSTSGASFDAEVASIAMPFGKVGGDPMGAISIPLFVSDMTPERIEVLLPLLRTAVSKLERAVSGA